ncbi:catalase family peroxidase [Luteimonas changyuni]|uniref:catalase family peroxidase n=1 Tax=Luteimonas sp. MJ145 TaxID=3129234 RepID=UPI0031BB72F9
MNSGKNPRKHWPALVAIALIAGGLAAAFLFTSGRVGDRITTSTFLENTPPSFPAGYRRAHGKGMCFDGVFRPSTEAAGLSRARVFSAPQTPVIGRFSIGAGSPYADDRSTKTVSMALLLDADGQQWRMKLNNSPYFPTRDAPGFLALGKATTPDPATGQPDPAKVSAFLARYPEAAKHMAASEKTPWPGNFSGARLHAMHAYFFVGEAGERQAVRWSFRPHAPFVAATAEERDKGGVNMLFDGLAEQLSHAPLKWDLVLQIAEPGDPTDDPSQPWPDSREQVVAGTLEVRRVFEQATGACRDINFDPTLVPPGIELSDDPVLAARAGIYAHSYNARQREIGYGKATDAVGKEAPR